MKLLTNLLFEPKGVHDPALAYTIKDTVMSPDGSKVYFALQDVPSGIALTDEDYWMLQIDLSGSKNAMDEAVAAFADYAKIVGTRVKGETAKATGNPVAFLPDAGSLLQPVTVLEPLQEGSGDPYPAGGGRNLLDTRGLIERVDKGVTFTPVYDDLGRLLYINANGTATDDHAYYYCTREQAYVVELPLGEAFTLSGASELSGGLGSIKIQSKDYSTVDATDRGSGVTFTASYEGTYGVWITVYNGETVSNAHIRPQIEAGSVATEYAPYSNIRPFIGYDKLDLNHAGKNLWSFGDINGTKVESREISIPAGNYVLSGVYTSSDTDNTQSRIQVEATSGEKKTFYVNRGERFACATNFSVPIRAILFYASTNSSASDGDAFTVKDIQIESGEVATPFTPYQSNTLHTVQIGQTVYGGKLDWLTGKLVAEWAMYQPTSDSTWYVEVKDTGVTRATQRKNVDAEIQGADGFFSHGIYLEKWADDRPHAYMSNGALSMTMPTSAIGSTSDSVNAYIDAQTAAGTPVQIAYKLATPIEIQLAPNVISAADPEQTNTLYGDGTIEVEYVKPLHVSIEERVAAALAAAAE